ncbi:MAG: GatB/YqeY domain-containing protein [Candidatus Atribacteria bacterium]|nr:GatB/YqeY domain-containing protein [Candidatus Atribacteria bacterium]
MSLKNQIENDLHEFMRTKNEIGRNTLRMVLSSVKLFEIEKTIQADDAVILSLIQKEIKTRRDSLIEFEKGNRPDLIKSTNVEIGILENYLPEQLSDAEIERIVSKCILDNGFATPADMGKAMKAVLPLLSGKAPSDKVSSIVRKKLIG